MNASTLRPQVTLTQVEVAIARCLNAHPVIDYTLPRESNPLTELFALMVFHRIAVVEAPRLDEKTLAALGQWGVAQ
jgi:hypothetical protein